MDKDLISPDPNLLFLIDQSMIVELIPDGLVDHVFNDALDAGLPLLLNSFLLIDNKDSETGIENVNLNLNC